jgi:hypothetical protein
MTTEQRDAVLRDFQVGLPPDETHDAVALADEIVRLRHRAERAEHRVRDLEVAVREWWDHGNDDQLWTEVFAADSPDDVEARLRALDAEAQP